MLTCRSRWEDESIRLESVLLAISPFTPPSISIFTFEQRTFLEIEDNVATLFPSVLSLVSK